MERTPLSTFMAQVNERLKPLRDGLRAAAPTVLPRLPGPKDSFSGTAFVESAGTTLTFTGGVSEGLYTPNSVHMRDASLAAVGAEREQFFATIGARFPSGSRILNIGAGGDVALIRALQREGHEVVSTDLAEETVRLLRERVDAPAFACDHVHLASVLPEPVDYVVGNSTLGYVEPHKLADAVSNVWRAMRGGAVFTFDLAPNPLYFDLAEGVTQRLVTNAAEPDPRKLLEFIEKYGPEDGLNAMAWFTHYRALAVNLAVASLLREKFTAHGGRCRLGLLTIEAAKGGKQQVVGLRVARENETVLEPLPEETLVESPLAALTEDAEHGAPFFALVAIDRDAGERLARALGIHDDRRRDPWKVAEYVHRMQRSTSLNRETRVAVLSELDPVRFADQVRPFVDGAALPQMLPPPEHLVADQTIHKLVFTGALKLDPETADLKIDEVYERAAQKEARVDARKAARKADADKKKDRKKKQKARKGQRRKK